MFAPGPLSPILRDYHAKRAADLLATFLTCSRKSAHVRLDPQSHLSPRKKQPAFPGAEWLGRISLYPRLVSCKRMQSLWRWCGDGVEVHWLYHRAGPVQWDNPGPRKSLA
jgi:hypothetical protein